MEWVMFWNSDNHQTITSNWSITVRIVVLYTLLGAIILALTTGFLYWVLENNIEKADKNFLNDKIEVLKSISLESNPNFERLEEEVQWEVEVYQFNRYYARVLNGNGLVIIETPNMSSLLPFFVFPSTTKEAIQQTKAREWRSKEGEQYLLMSEQISVPDTVDQVRIVQVALNISSQEQLLSNYLHTILIVLFVSILFLGIAGAFVARKGMQPINEIAKTAERISASELQERTNPSRWPTELYALAGAFDKMMDRLEASFTHLHQFSADIAHELRTPISNLMGETEVALSKTRNVEEYREVLESNLEEYNRLSQLIKNLLFLAETDHSDFEVSKKSVDVPKEMKEIISFFEVLASERAIQITCEGHSRVQADPGLFRRAVSNVLSNAIQYAPDHSRIGIHLFEENELSQITIKDEGLGIAQEHIPKLFDRFYRVDSSRSSKLGGTGLGLPIVKSIMELHKGNIKIQSHEKEGTTVILIFPK